MKGTIRTGSVALVPLALLATLVPMLLRTTVTAQKDKPQPGDKVVFAVPAATAISVGVDKVLYTGRSLGTVNAAGLRERRLSASEGGAR